MEIKKQLTEFLVWIIYGIQVGILVDGYRAWIWQWHIRKGIVLGDCLVWCLLAVGVFSVSFYLNGGELRLYFFVTLLSGYLAYRRVVGNRMMRVWAKGIAIFRRIGRCLCRIVRFAWFPIGVLQKRCVVLLRWLRRWIIAK